MKTINQHTLEIVDFDIGKYNLILKKTRQKDIVLMRWAVFAELINRGVKQYQIALFFSTSDANVLHGLKRNAEIVDFEERRKRIVKF